MREARKNKAISESVSWRKTGEEAVLLDLETSEYYSLNDTGTFIWERFAAGKPLSSITEELAAEYGISAGQAARDAEAFLKDLSALKILNEGDVK